MKIAITGGTGFVGGHLARRLAAEGHEVVPIGRAIGLDDVGKLAQAFAGCAAVAHCAGINREIGTQTYARVHVQGTKNVVAAARRAGAKKVALISFLRARPQCGSPYHESKWAAEEIVRDSGLDYTVLKAGVIYGRGDHMLDHLSRAFHTFPLFALVGMKDKPVRPAAVEDVVNVLHACLVDGRLARTTVAVIGPEEMPLREAVRRVAETVGKVPPMIPLPLIIHRLLAGLFEATMNIPLLASAQLRILSEGITEPLPFAESLPVDLAPATGFSTAQIRKGLPPPGGFGWRDLRFSCASGGRP